ncbi:MAG TPA: hypothetical protein VEI07_18630 [Planctomycetaceae bacterium]|nr:hypothetical protein [Planctomycetaceae bacterium]
MPANVNFWAAKDSVFAIGELMDVRIKATAAGSENPGDWTVALIVSRDAVDALGLETGEMRQALGRIVLDAIRQAKDKEVQSV